ncbi:transposase [Bacillus cereus]|nr:transposase [Bacillus thuringiensis serovar dakota]TKH68132.1 transposase [Bacillus cereus]
MVNKHPNKTGLLNYTSKKKKKTQYQVTKVIQLMIKEGQKVNFNSVSEKALVSKAYLYREPLIRKTIEDLRQQQGGLLDLKTLKRNTSDASKDIIIETLKNKINLLKHKNKLLESENENLKTQIKKELGKVYENL